MSVRERPIERLNFYNGERLEARDLRAEQDYHVRVRRLINRSLYSAGIVRGLEVTKDPNDKHKVIVAPGLAFDIAGRELMLLEPAAVQVVGAPSSTPGFVLGNFLVMSYLEERGQPATDRCATHGDRPCSCDMSWAGPTRIRSMVTLDFVDAFPADSTGRVVLAQIELKKGCEVAAIHTGVRKYAVTAKPPTAKTVSIEGEKDIDSLNPKTLYFHVEGGYPVGVMLHLRASKFSSLYYTELGQHTHTITATTASVTKNLAHTHGLTAPATTNRTGNHQHDYYVDDGERDGGIDVNDTQDRANNRRNSDNSALIAAGDHEHTIAALNLDKGTFDDGPLSWPHSHSVTASAANAGVTNVSARGGAAFTYLNDVRIWFDGTEITNKVLQHLASRDPLNWPPGSKIGDGTATHVLVIDGTKGIPLLQLVDDIGPGEHKLEFKVPSGGGQLHYNLYVE